MAGAVENGVCQLILGVGRDSLSRRQMLGRADFDDKMPAWDQVAAGLVHQSIENGETAGSAVESQVRFVVPYSGRQPVHFFMCDVGWIAHDEVEPLILGKGIEEIALEETNALGHPVLAGVARSHIERLC